MPELPEVETIARQLAPLLAGRRITRVNIVDAKLDDAQLIASAGYSIADVRREGKQIALRLTKPRGKPREQYLLVHLRMTGRLIYDATQLAPEQKYLRAWFELDCGRLAFHDQRRFGTLTIATGLDAAAGPPYDPLAPQFTKQVLAELLAGSRQPLKSWLLRQDKLAGIGNIYASEILHATGLHPLRPAGTLNPDETAALHGAVRAILRLAIKHCGTTFSDFQDAHGVSGRFQRLLKVYGREGLPCAACQTALVRLVQQQRSTFYCPQCQRWP